MAGCEEEGSSNRRVVMAAAAAEDEEEEEECAAVAGEGGEVAPVKRKMVPLPMADVKWILAQKREPYTDPDTLSDELPESCRKAIRRSNIIRNKVKAAIESDGCCMVDSDFVARRERCRAKVNDAWAKLLDGISLSDSDCDYEDEEDEEDMARLLGKELDLFDFDALLKYHMVIIRSYVVEKCGFLSREQTTPRADGKPSELWPVAVWLLVAPVVPAPSSAGKPEVEGGEWIWENTGTVSANIRNHNSSANLDLALQLYDEYLALLALQKEVEWLRSERNAAANKMIRKLEPSLCQALFQEEPKEGLIALEEDLVQLTNKLQLETQRILDTHPDLTDNLQLEAESIPNTTHPDVPVGVTEDLLSERIEGSHGNFRFTLKDHLRLGKELELFDFDAAAEV
uniref:Uncharacterized protein n=1 Tax=Leersia perrieri TaxID=77586 RepID=A0A0D9XU37_9ORYZ